MSIVKIAIGSIVEISGTRVAKRAAKIERFLLEVVRDASICLLNSKAFPGKHTAAHIFQNCNFSATFGAIARCVVLLWKATHCCAS